MAPPPHNTALPCKGTAKTGAPCRRTTRRGYFCTLHRPIPPHPTGPLTLLSLPPELRLEIYSHLDVSGSAPVDIGFDNTTNKLQLGKSEKIKHGGAILLVCRQIFTDLYGQLRFVFHGERAFARLTQLGRPAVGLGSKVVEVRFHPEEEEDVPTAVDFYYISHRCTEFIPKCIPNA